MTNGVLPGPNSMTTAERIGLRIQFDNSYARLPERFAVRLSPIPVTAPRLVRMNEPLARKLGLIRRSLRPNREWKCLPAIGLLKAASHWRWRMPATNSAASFLSLGWSRHPARRGYRPGWHKARHPTQGLRADAIFTSRRRPRSARSGIA